jgi:hypothetical protein
MKVKSAVFAIFIGGLVLSLPSISLGVVDTRAVDEVIKKGVLTPQDLEVIDRFILDAVQDIVQTDDFTQIATVRTIIIARQGTQAQYAQKFSESALKHISWGLQQAQGDSDPARRFKVMVNLLILVDGLKDPRLVDLAVGSITQDNNSVRYWAVRTATDATLWTKISQNQAAAAQLAGRIITECRKAVKNSSPEVLNLMVDFAGRHSSPEAAGLLMDVADERVRCYADWTARYELADAAILKLLSNSLTAGPNPNPEMARRFAQLYSFVIQRYIKGQQQNALKDNSRNYLASVIAEVEDKCISKLLGARQPTLTRAVQESNLDALQAEHDRLLGGAGQAGALVSKLNFKYGNRPTPLLLPDSPASATAPATPPSPQPAPQTGPQASPPPASPNHMNMK